MMNKYLLKVAAKKPRVPSELHDLEPGIQYDRTKHEIKVSKDAKASIEGRSNTLAGISSGVVGGMYGAAAGAFAGLALKNKFSNHVLKKYAIPVGITSGVAALGAGGFALGKSTNDPKPYYEKHLEKLERKHEKAIDKIEGWDT